MMRRITYLKFRTGSRMCNRNHAIRVSVNMPWLLFGTCLRIIVYLRVNAG